MKGRMKFLKKTVVLLGASALMLGAFPIQHMNVSRIIIASAENEYTEEDLSDDIFTYSNNNNCIIITGLTGKGSTNIVIPEMIEGRLVTEIGKRAFSGWNITSIEIPDSVTELGEGAFYNCENLKSVKLSSSVTSIPDYCFLNCEKMTECDIPEGVDWIGWYAFENTGMTTITLPSTLSYCYGWDSFCYNENLTEFVVAEGNENYAAVDGVLVSKMPTKILCYPGGREGAYTVPERYSLSLDTFAGCRKLASLTLPDSFNVNYGFLYLKDCDQLTALNVSNTHPDLKSVDGILYTKDGTEIVRVPNGIKGAFTIPGGVTTVWSDSFSGIKGITEIVVPANVTKIESYSFSAMEGLTSITIENPNCVIEGDKYTIYNSLEGYNAKFTGFIYGYEGSTAQAYAEKYGYNFAVIGSVSSESGDCNNDGVFNVSDVVLLQKWLLAVPNTNLANWKAADLCEDGRLDVFDLCLMKRMLVENS